MVRLRSADLIARDGEIGELRAALDAARGGQHGAVVVCGPAGIGKSRLVEEFVRRFRRDEDLLMVGHCVDLSGEEIPYAAVSDALRRMLREQGLSTVRDLLGPAAGPLSVLVPHLAREAESDEPAPAPPTSRDRPGVHILQEFVAGLEHASRGSGQLVWLWLEDLQWADRATRTLISYLLRVDGPPNLLVTATVRTEDPSSPGTGELVGELLRIPHVDQMVLRPFTRGQVAEHLQALTGSRPRAAVLNAAVPLSGGIPFYTELLVREGMSDGVLLPSAVRWMVRGALDTLEADAVAVVEAAAVESGRLPHDVLVAVAGGGAEALAGIAAAVEAAVLAPEADGSGYRFRHAILREAVQAGLLPEGRRRWHRAWAEQLELAAESTGDTFARVAAAHHWAAAGDNSRAFDAVLDGAALAQAMFADAEASTLLVKALRLWPAVPDAADRAGFDRETLFLASWVGTFVSGRSDLLEILNTVRPAGRNPVRDLYMTYALLENAEWRPSRDDIAVLLESPLANPWLPRTAGTAGLLLLETDLDSALALAERANEAAELAARHLRAGHARPGLSWVTGLEQLFAEHVQAEVRFAASGRAEDRAAFYAQFRPRCAAVSAPVGLECDMFLAKTCAAQGRHRDAYSLAAATLAALPEPRQHLSLYTGCTFLAADAQVALGEWDQALSRLDAARREIDDDDLSYELVALAGLLRSWRGSIDTAEHCAAVASASLANAESCLALWETRWLQAELAATRSEASDVRRLLRPLWAVPHPESASDVLWRPLMSAVKTNVEDIVGNPERSTDAREDLETCQTVAAKLHRIGAVGAAWDLHLSAELSRLDGPSDPSLWAAAEEAWVAAGWVRERALALLGLAAAHARSGSRDDARDALAAARGIARQLRAVPLEAAAAELARNARLEPPARGVRSPGLPGLTAREREVLSLVASGFSNNRIATELFISPKTASVHVSNILAKLHATSRTEAVALAHRAGLIETP